MTKPTGLIRVGDFVVPDNFAELAAAQGPLDEPYPMFSLLPFQEVDLDAIPKPWKTLPLEPGLGPPYDTAPQDTRPQSAATSDATAPAQPRESAPDRQTVTSAGTPAPSPSKNSCEG
jgi:hypothetical protein